MIGHDHVAGLGHLDLGPVTWFPVVGQDRFDDPDVEVTFPDPAAWDLVVTLGAPWPRRSIAGWAAAETAFLDGARRAGSAVLGILLRRPARHRDARRIRAAPVGAADRMVDGASV